MIAQTSTLPATLSLPPSAPAAARAVFRVLSHLSIGRLQVQLPDGSSAHFGAGAHETSAPHAAIRLVNWNVCAAALKFGDIGFAESYIAGDWHTPDLPALLHLLIDRKSVV